MTGLDHILIVDDNQDLCSLLRHGLAPLGYDITVAYDGLRALQLLESGIFNLMILDLMLPQLNGIDVLRNIRAQHPEVEVIVLTAYASLESAIEALRLGAYDYVTKPFSMEAIRSAVRRALEKQHMSKRLNVIYDLSREMTLSLGVLQVSQTILDTARRVFDYRVCDLWLADENKHELYCLSGYGDASTPSRLSLDSEQGIMAAAARSGETLYIPDTREDFRYVAFGMPNHSELAIPLTAKGRLIGVLNIESTETKAFGPADIQLFAILAAQAAVAIDNAQMYEKTQRELGERRNTETALQQANRELALLNSAVQTLTSSLNLDQVLSSILEQVRHLLQADTGSVWLRDAESDELVCQQSAGRNSQVVRGWRLSVGEGLVGWVARTGKSLIVADAPSDERHYRNVDAHTGLLLRSILSVPLWIKHG